MTVQLDGPGENDALDMINGEEVAAMHEDIINRYIQSYNDRDIEGMLDCVTEDVVFENISNASQSMRLEGRDQMGEVARLSGNAFSYRRQRLISIVIGEGKAAAEIEFEGKAAVDLPNGVRAGETVKIRGASFFEFRGRLLSRIADYS
ncbi:MAG: nuclear transport factor 2 family protein [Pseudomonadota bacterium]